MEIENKLLISQYIDDELDLNEKILFVQEVSANKDFADEAVELLEMEQGMELFEGVQAPEIPEIPQASKVVSADFSDKKSKSGFVAAASTLVAVAASVMLFLNISFAPKMDEKIMHRFVLHVPNAQTVAVSGSFSNWENIAMKRTGSGGYWTVSVPLNKGDHYYSFIVDGDKILADPTVAAKQKDDFGGENSIIKIGDRV